MISPGAFTASGVSYFSPSRGDTSFLINDLWRRSGSVILRIKPPEGPTKLYVSSYSNHTEQMNRPHLINLTQILCSKTANCPVWTRE